MQISDIFYNCPQEQQQESKSKDLGIDAHGQKHPTL